MAITLPATTSIPGSINITLAILGMGAEGKNQPRSARSASITPAIIAIVPPAKLSNNRVNGTGGPRYPRYPQKEEPDDIIMKPLRLMEKLTIGQGK